MKDTIAASAEKVTMADMRVLKPPDRKKISRRMKQLFRERDKWETRWKAIRDYQLPFVGEFEDEDHNSNPAKRRDLKMAQGTAWIAAQIFAAGVMSGLTPPSRQWFRLTFSRTELENEVDFQRVLDERQEIMYSVLSKSNFYNSVHSCYMELPFGTAPMLILPDVHKGIRCVPLTIGTYALDVGGSGVVNTLARRVEMTLPQIVDSFGEDSLPEAFKNKPDSGKRYKVNWLVCPNPDADPRQLDRFSMPYLSVYWMEGSQPEEYLYVGGFEEFPCPTARYLVNGFDPYGKGCGWFAEGDAKSLQVMKKDYLTALELSVKPPLTAPPNVLVNGINLIPGGVTPVMGQGNEKVAPLFNVNLNLEHLAQEIQRCEEQILKHYNANLFMAISAIDTGSMTAREVVERQQEKLQQLGPVVERLQDEFLSKILERVYGILDKANMFPPIPDDIAEQIADEDIKIDYISPLAQAQKMSGLVNIEQYVAFVATMANMWPDTLKTVDEIGMIQTYGDLLGVPAAGKRSREDVEAMIQQEQMALQEQQQAMQMQQMAQAAPQLAQAAKAATEAANDGNPALSQWLGMGGGAGV